MHKLPRLYQSRHGVYYLRVIRNKVKTRLSLGTKDFRIARLFALRLNMELAMSTPDFDPDKLRKLDIEVSPTGGVNFKDVNPSRLWSCADTRLSRFLDFVFRHHGISIGAKS
ncbi:hypothetical protein [Ralstonia insidiosa]|uniref:hypothetical protein n=1 Tax=Ralstonia insidiosa TaxID=190721 RepID=UPI0020165779|nr:hypothetical protein [Ralstonia insidiosa]